MRRPLSLASLSLLLCATCLWPARPAPAQGLDARMQRVVAKFVEKTGASVMTVGSWVKGHFDPATSDFDMRLVIPKEGAGTSARQLAQWQEARRSLTSLIQEEFGSQAGSILGRTNLYAPGELMTGVADSEEAVARFRQLGTAPNLAFKGTVGPNTPVKVMEKITEGVYGAGAQTYVQGYEQSAGRLFYKSGEKCVTGLSEMAGTKAFEDLGEGARYTASGSANTAGQFAEKALGELAAGRGDKVAKQLERMELALTKSRSMSAIPLDEAYRSELVSMRDLLKKNPEQLGEVGGKLARLLARGRTEAAILRSMEGAGPMRGMYLKVMLDGVQAGNKVGALMDKLMAQVPSWVDVGGAMNFWVMCVGTQATSQALGKGDKIEAIGTSAEYLKWLAVSGQSLAAFGPLVMAELTAAILTEARAGGYEMVAGSQNAWDLMEGIYSAWGRVDVDPDPRRRITLADMVTRYQYENRLKNLVWGQALRASTRHLGEATAEADQGVAEAIYSQCWPVIREAWLWQRDCLMTEYLASAAELIRTPLLISYKPLPAQPGQQFSCEAASLDRKLSERLDRMEQIIRVLYGPGSSLVVDYNWTPTGVSVGDRRWQRGFTYPDPGTYPTKVTLAVHPNTAHTLTEPRIMLQREVSALVDVVVGGAPPICPACGKPAGTNPNCMHCTLYKH